MNILRAAIFKLKMIFANFPLLIVLACFAAIVVWISGYVFEFNKNSSIQVLWVDEDRSIYSELLYKNLSSNKGISLEKSDFDMGKKLLSENKKEIMLKINNGFDSALRNYEKNTGKISMFIAPSAISQSYATESIVGELMKLGSYGLAEHLVKRTANENNKILTDNFISDMHKWIDTFWHPSPYMKLEIIDFMSGSRLPANTADSSVLSTPGPQIFSAFGFFPLLIMLFILFSSGWLADEKTSGTFSRLLSIKNGLLKSYIASAIALTCSGIITATLYILILLLLFGINIFSIINIAAVIIFILFNVGLALAASVIINQRGLYQSFVVSFTFFTSIAAGCFWNIPSLNSDVDMIKNFLPQGYLLNIINGQNNNQVHLYTAIWLCISVILLYSGYYILRWKLRFAKKNNFSIL